MTFGRDRARRDDAVARFQELAAAANRRTSFATKRKLDPVSEEVSCVVDRAMRTSSPTMSTVAIINLRDLNAQVLKVGRQMINGMIRQHLGECYDVLTRIRSKGGEFDGWEIVKIR